MRTVECPKLRELLWVEDIVRLELLRMKGTIRLGTSKSFGGWIPKCGRSWECVHNP